MITLDVEGMTCNHCKRAVEQALSALPDAQDVVVDLEAGRASLAGTQDTQAILAAIADEGFTATITTMDRVG